MKHSRILPHVFFAILVGVFVFLNNSSLNSNLKQNKTIQSSPTNKTSSVKEETARVLRVIDGDTVEVSLDNKKENVRLIGIDTLETMDPRESVQCFGKEASEKAKELLSGKIVRLEKDLTQGDKDKYGRLLRYVFIDDLNVNKLMISEGYAHEYTYQSNPYKYQLEFIAAEKSAREQNLGLWSDVVKCNRE